MFQALYRKYRPQTFNDIVGQNHIVSVLKNAIEKNQISHAYLFYGPRGTGKTSIAKIFANEVNRNEVYQKENVDIIEIDAASNNGVDEVRDIKEAIKFLPSEGKYKVYIIDEVHMLTTAAFNALLKTLEEPPAHVIFILATTEIHKIPATILSRCQRFEFKNLSVEQLEDRLKYISENERLDIEEDAISILDQVSNYSEKITLENILEVTSSISEDSILEFYKYLLQGDVTKSLLMYNDFVAQAKDTKLLLNDLINITRDIVVYKNLNNTNYTNYNVKIIEDVVKDVPFDYFYKIIEYLSQTEQYIRFSTEYMSYMQICIVKICSIANYSNTKIDVVSNDGSNIVVNTQIQELESRIILLEKKLLQIKNQKVDLNNKIDNSSTTKDSYLSNNVEIKEVIIKDKSKIVELINSSNDNFTNYASNVFGRIINDSFSADNNEMYAMGEIFKSCKLVASSKIAGLLVFNEAESMIKMAPNSKYKKYLEELFRRYIGVDYAIYTLQDNQYNTLLDEIKNISPKKDSLVEIKEEQEEKKDSKNNSKIEQLFSDIIVEK